MTEETVTLPRATIQKIVAKLEEAASILRGEKRE